MITADDVNADLCTLGGTGHDYRVYEYKPFPDADLQRSWRCVWCHVVACGDVSEADPCWLPYHHEPQPHRSRDAVIWPIGGNRA